MNDAKNSSDPTPDSESQSFKRNYAGTFVAKRIHQQEHSVDAKTKGNDCEDYPMPPEMKAFFACLRKNHSAITAVSSVLIFLATAIYAGFAIKQWTAMEESNAINREALETVQRAFVSFQHLQFDTSTIVDQKGPHEYVDFTAQWENVGATSAKVTDHMFDVAELTAEPSDEEFRRGINQKGQHISRYIGPHGAYSIGPFLIPYDRIIKNTPKAQASNFRTVFINDPKKLMFFGWMVYRDTFENTAPHITEFCRIKASAGFLSKPPSDKLHIDFGFCQEHNCADEQCKDYKDITALTQK